MGGGSGGNEREGNGEGGCKSTSLKEKGFCKEYSKVFLTVISDVDKETSCMV